MNLHSEPLNVLWLQSDSHSSGVVATGSRWRCFNKLLFFLEFLHEETVNGWSDLNTIEDQVLIKVLYFDISTISGSFIANCIKHRRQNAERISITASQLMKTRVSSRCSPFIKPAASGHFSNGMVKTETTFGMSTLMRDLSSRLRALRRSSQWRSAVL